MSIVKLLIWATVGFFSGSASQAFFDNENLQGSRVRDVDDPKHYYFIEGNGKLTSLLSALENLAQHVPEYLQEMPFPEGFAFPPSFEYNMNVG